MSNKLKDDMQTFNGTIKEISVDHEKLANLAKKVFAKNYSFYDIKEEAEKLGIVGMSYKDDNSIILDFDFSDQAGRNIILPSSVLLRKGEEEFSCKPSKLYVRDNQYPSCKQMLQKNNIPRSVFITTADKKLSVDAQVKEFEASALGWVNTFIKAYGNMNVGDSVTIAQLGQLNYVDISKLTDNGMAVDIVGRIFEDRNKFYEIVRFAAEKEKISYINDRKNRVSKLKKA